MLTTANVCSDGGQRRFAVRRPFSWVAWVGTWALAVGACTGRDDGNLTPSASATAGDTDGSDGWCGDGHVDSALGEECDPEADARSTCRSDCLWAVRATWEFSENGTANDNEWANAVVMDDQGNAYIGGTIFNAGFSDLWLRKVDVDGNEIWTITFDDTDGLSELANAIAFHPSGDLIVTGFNEGPDFASTNIMLRVDPDDGAIRWSQGMAISISGGCQRQSRSRTTDP